MGKSDEQYAKEISEMFDKLDTKLPESYDTIDFEFIDALVCGNCGYWAKTVLTIGNMCLHPEHPIMHLPDKKACKDHHRGTLPEGTEMVLPLQQQYLKIIHSISDEKRKYAKLHRDFEWAIKYQKKRKKVKPK